MLTHCYRDSVTSVNGQACPGTGNKRLTSQHAYCEHLSFSGMALLIRLISQMPQRNVRIQFLVQNEMLVLGFGT